jgi:hypothetical protein
MNKRAESNRDSGLLQALEVRLQSLIKQMDELRLTATPNILLLETAEENLQFAVDALLESEFDEVETLLSLVVKDLQYV